MKKIQGVLLGLIFLMFTSCGGGGGDAVIPPLSAEKAITAYSINGIAGTINETSKTIAITVPFGTNVTALIATFNTTGTSVKVDATVQVSGTTANDFTSPVVYTVTAADATTQDYMVTVTVETADYISPNIGVLIYVPAGSFWRDNDVANISTISDAYRMSQHEITRAQFQEVMGTDPSDGTRSTGTDDPVQNVNWYHAIAFCNKLSLLEGLTPVYSVTGVNFSTLTYAAIPLVSTPAWNDVIANWSANGYRLPTEMEWMWAAMGATSALGYETPWYRTGYAKPFAGSNATNAAGDNGTNVIGDYAWYAGNSGGTTHQVGTKLPNELGLYDMSGNVWEWCWDRWAAYPGGLLRDYRGADSGTWRVHRGGAWPNASNLLELDHRDWNLPEEITFQDGLRVVRP